MKKYTLFVLLLVTVLLLIKCSTPKAAALNTLPAQEFSDYPDDLVADTAKQRFVKEFNKGYALYKIACSKCHNIKAEGKDIIPDFSLPQLMDYELRIQYPAHGDELKETNITHDELEWIVTFLRYKKKTGYDINKYLKR